MLAELRPEVLRMCMPLFVCTIPCKGSQQTASDVRNLHSKYKARHMLHHKDIYYQGRTLGRELVGYALCRFIEGEAYTSECRYNSFGMEDWCV